MGLSIKNLILWSFILALCLPHITIAQDEPTYDENPDDSGEDGPCFGYQCEDGTCLAKGQQCDGNTDCPNGEDEDDCTDEQCEQDEFYCSADRRCIEIERQCDGTPDCTDHADEANCPQPPEPEECPEDKCNDGSCIYASQRCDDRIDCADGEDEERCPCRDNEFRCNDGTCISSRLKCDRRQDCRDGSDEADCTVCRPGEFQCLTGECINQNRKCDRHIDCRDASDEADCRYPPTRPPTRPTPPRPTYLPTTYPSRHCDRNTEWRCGSGECIPLHSRCDSFRNCRDGSDERNCPSPPAPPSGPVRLNLKTYPNEQTIKERIIKEGREVVFQCRDEGPIRAKVQWLRAGGKQLPPGTRDLNGRLEIPNIKVEHSGDYICEAVGYPRNTLGNSVVVNLHVEKYDRNFPSNDTAACRSDQATCMNGDCIARTSICNGIFDCPDGSDENGCSSGRCEPNEFQCANRKCVLKTWRCDGENDCQDNSDEEGCSALSGPSSGPCRFDEFQCANRQCIPKSFQCDSQADCSDNSDEIGCLAPAVITPPPPFVTLQAGVVFNISCRATGNPIPLIVWRLNWGHIPEKCRTTSQNGYGTLTCPDIQPIDQGAYSCEIINSMGTHFVSPDTILIVQSENICPAGQFNGKAMRKEDCISCFCFGVSTQCKSADLFTYSLRPPVTSQTVVAVDGPWSGHREVLISEYDRHILSSTRHGVQFRVNSIPSSATNAFPYLSLPSEYHGNQLKSYGGFLRYELEFSGRGNPNDAPDVIIQGNGYTLTYRHSDRFYPNSRNNITAQLVAQNWYKIDGSYASREEVMMVLGGVENILIKLQYIDSEEKNVELLNINLDSAALADQGFGSASLVEECRCPAGYTGYSCESCAEGYVRQRSGAWLGRCVRAEEPCKAGTYGDPNRGIPCRPCPCPVPGQSRARTCTLESNGQVTCHCERGYIGSRCEQCAPGYIGSPMSPRGCTIVTQPPSPCNPAGTDRILPNGQCQCKPNVVGPRCDQCSASTFHLNPRTGCINCFCMGVSNDCTSTSYYRDTIRASFATPQTDFALVSGYENAVPVASRLRVQNSEVSYRQFAVNDDTYYWSLPPSFLGNIITSYGGNLTYTVRYVSQPSGAQSRSNSPNVVIVSANEITLHHYRQDNTPPFGTQTFNVPIFEEQWQHYEEGVSATRQHLLMTLANVTAIYIKATYTTVAEEAALSQVSLDIAKEQNFGSNQRAWEVEQCNCPTGHEGLSCEDCSPGYYKGDEGLYLGLCEPCNCNGHSEDCDSKTGVCRNCRDNTEGDNCEYCRPGFVGNATVGGCYRQRPEDSTNCNTCEIKGTSSCDTRRGTCNCKPNVVGIRCDQCREGTFGLSEANPYGCNECFCSGTTRSCSEGIYYREEIPLFIPNEVNKFKLTDRDGNNALPTNAFETSIDDNKISYSFNDDSYTYYWNLPDRLSGNLILSYGGKLEYTQYTDGTGPYVEDQDIIVKGNGITLVHSRNDLETESYSVRFVESEWQTLQRNGPAPASRSDIITVLSNVESIRIRASIRSYTSQSALSDLVLESAVKQPTRSGMVSGIEVCHCPPGYKGTSCEQCDSKYYRDFTDRSAGLLGTCKICPCDNSESCEMLPNRRVSCRCQPGWTGDLCRDRAGQPTPAPPPTRPTPRPPSIKVNITYPSIKIVEIGETIEFNCNAYYIVNNRPITIRWMKYEGSLSERTRVEQGRLYIQDAQLADSGVYICQAQVGNEIVRDNVTLTVGDTYPRAPEVSVSPRGINQDEFSVAELRCTASGSPQPRVEWRRLDGYLSTDVINRDGYLRFNSLRKADEGSYQCVAHNEAGEADLTVPVYVRAQVARPPAREEVRIEPSQYNGEPGEEIKLYCTPSTPGTVSWTKAGSVDLPENAYVSGDVLTIEYATVANSGRYVCIVRFPSGVTRQSTADITIYSRSTDITPKIQPFEQRYTVIQGTDFELICDFTGTPTPTIVWTMNGAPLSGNARQVGNTLRITNIRPENSGGYICSATNAAGEDQQATVVDVERREPPVIEIFPREPQKLRVGESARFSCRSTSGTPHPTITWVRRDGRPLSSRFTEDYPGVITLREATLEDAGLYECRASNIAGQTSLSTNLEIQQQPSISLIPDKERHDLTEGEELIFTCLASGVPAPNVQIKFPDSARDVTPAKFNEIRRDESQATLTHYNIQRHQAGIYECIATNEAGQDIRYVQVSVAQRRGDVGNADNDPPRIDDNSNPGIWTDQQPTQPTYPGWGRPYPPEEPEGRPINPQPRPQPTPFTVHLGDSATLNCRAEEGNVRTEWRRVDGNRLPSTASIRGGQLIIENVRNDAQGEYECLVYDRDRRPIVLVRAQIIVVAGPPKITLNPPMPMTVRAGEDVLIYCNATGEGPIQVQWHGEGGQRLPTSVDVSGGYIRFNRITPADQGRYVCTASNRYGNATKVAEVIVDNLPPQVRPDYGKTKEGYEGDTVTLTCTDEAFGGNIIYEWEKENEELPPLHENRENVLILYNTKYNDGGRYICKIYAQDGSMTQNYVDLVIKPRIPHLKLEPAFSRVRPGGTAEVECISSTDSEVVWYKDNRDSIPRNFMQQGNRLIIYDAREEDSGKYRCVCYSSDGQEVDTEYELVVEQPPPTLINQKNIEHAEVGTTKLLNCNVPRIPGTSYTWERQHGSFSPDIDTSSESLKLINVQSSDAGTYICRTNVNGRITESSTTLVVTGAIPFFPQSPKSYMKFPKLDQAYSKFNFEITFRPERPNGIILYNGQRRGEGDYIALSLVNGVPQFRYTFGDQKGILKPEKPLSLGEWHTIKVNRVRTNGWMIVDDQHPVIFPPNQKFQGLNLEEELYLGGHPKYEHIAPSASEVKEGFVGCISRLVLQERDIQINQEAILIEGTTSCEPCADEPCQNDGVCLETQTDYGYTCVCPEGFTGRNCQVNGAQCSLGVCGIGRCGETETGIECYCPLNRTGDRCQYIEHYNDGILAFRDGSYAAYDKLSGKKNIKFKIRPESNEDGVILYAAESERAFGDFIAVVVKDKHIEFRYIVGGKILPVIIRSLNPIKVHEWMDISVGRSRAGLGYLQVDNEPQQNEQKSAGRAQILYLKTNLYMGGYDKRIVLNQGVGVTKGFQGCVAGLELAGKSIDMIAELRDSANVQNCGHQPFVPPEDEDFSGDEEETTSNAPPPTQNKPCRPGFSGRRCDIITDICLANEPCENGGVCTKLPDNQYRCDCTLGYSGDNCQYTVQIEQSAGFKGNSYLELDRTAVSNSTTQLSSGIAILFSTKQPNGLLIWYGQEKGSAFNGDDFLALAVVDGFLEFSLRLDGEETTIRHYNTRVDNNARHIAIIKRNNNQASLELDGLTEYGETRPTAKKDMFLPGHVFLGGAPDLKSFTGERYTQGFVGCIHIVEPLEGGPIRLGEKTISSLNVEQCSEAEDDESVLGTEPPVV